MSQNSPRNESVTIHRLLFGSSLLLSHEMVEPCQFSPAEPVDCFGFIQDQPPDAHTSRGRRGPGAARQEPGRLLRDPGGQEPDEGCSVKIECDE